MIILNINKLLKSIKLNENKISTFFGILVIIVTGYFLSSYYIKKQSNNLEIVEIGNEKTAQNSYEVKAGDDLWKISMDFYGTGYNWGKIAEANNINSPYVISEGQNINIPVIQETTDEEQSKQKDPEITNVINNETVSDQTSNTVNLDTNKYVVIKGDTLWSISEKLTGNGFNWKQLADENSISSPYVIEVGQELVVSNDQINTNTKINEYTVKKGDNLWNIAINIFGDGYKWINISKDNNITNPNVILVGQVLKITY